jgi:glycosyltransferase involved in cell wall biosynthesis
MADDVALFHPGVQHSWQTARALVELHRLSFYATSIFYRPDRWPYRIERYLPRGLAARAHAEFRRFAGPSLPPERLVTIGAFEWAERLASRAGRTGLAIRLDRQGNRRFGVGVAAAIARRDPAVLWGFDGSAGSVFTSPAAAGRRRILDRTTGDWRAYDRIMAPVRDRYAAYVAPGDRPVDARRIERDDREYEAADVILTGSRFAADTVIAEARDRGVAARVRVLPYCFDEALFADGPPRERARGGPLRVLMLGQANVRKGVHLALEAFRTIPAAAATLTLVGHLQVPAAAFAPHADRVAHQPTVARADVPALLRAHDVLLFPSYFEGAGIVLYEALAAGCALIQSRHAALAVTPATGILLDALTPEAVVAAVMALADDRDRLAIAQAAAPIEAQIHAFAGYRDRIAALLAE